MEPKRNCALILVNLGTPDAPDEESIRRFLKQFLSDPRVVDFPRWLWLPILNGIILKSRPKRLIEDYSNIWGESAGPIVEITFSLAKKLQTVLPSEMRVITAMTYGSPSIKDAMEEAKGFDQIIVLPMFPQYAGATTGAIEDQIDASRCELSVKKPIKLIRDYHDEPSYIKAVSRTITNPERFSKIDSKLVFSFHGIPQSQSKRGDPYQNQCKKTATLVAEQLGLKTEEWVLTFQSRFGPLPWLKPYTDKTMQKLPKLGIKDVTLVCPGFSADCLETIEEIDVENREFFLESGGNSFTYIEALNDTDDHVEMIKGIVLKQLLTWPL